MAFCSAKRFLSGLFLFSLTSFGSILPSSGFAQQATQVSAERVTLRSIAQTLPVSGRLVALQRGVVAARISAPIGDIHVEVGSPVKQGDPLISLVSNRLELQQQLANAQVNRAQAALKTAQAELDIVSQELARLQQLKKSAAFSQANFDDKRLEQLKARSAVNEARAAVATAQSDLALADLDVSYATITAPYEGVVTQRHVERGAYISVGQTVISLVSASALEIEADVPATYLAGLAKGSVVSVTLTGHPTPLSAVVRAVVPEENPLTRTRAVRFSLNDTEVLSNLASNQTLSVHVPIGDKRPVLSVAKDAVIAKNGGHIVFKVVEGKAIPTPVTIGVGIGSYFAVQQGLQEGDLVVTRGNERLRPNQTVNAVESTS